MTIRPFLKRRAITRTFWRALHVLAVLAWTWAGIEHQTRDAQNVEAGTVTANFRGLHGYISYSAARPPARAEYSAGMGFYSAVWPLIDEPTTFLDPKHEVEVMSLCRRLASDKGKTVIVTLHNLEMAVKTSDAMIFMKMGKVVASGKPDEVLNADLLEQVYDIPMKIVPYDGRKIILR